MAGAVFSCAGFAVLIRHWQDMLKSDAMLFSSSLGQWHECISLPAIQSLVHCDLFSLYQQVHVQVQVQQQQRHCLVFEQDIGIATDDCQSWNTVLPRVSFGDFVGLVPGRMWRTVCRRAALS
jgi:hypothetical protein